MCTSNGYTINALLRGIVFGVRSFASFGVLDVRSISQLPVADIHAYLSAFSYSNVCYFRDILSCNEVNTLLSLHYLFGYRYVHACA
jgi:hypothetical protein